MAATLPSPAAASPPPLLRRSPAPASLSFRRRRRWHYRPAARHDVRGSRLARWAPAAPLPPGDNGARGATAAAAAGEASCRGSEGRGSLWMVFLSTAVAVCGSFEFGTCVGYSAPAQVGIVRDIGLSNSQYGIFGSVLTIGAMAGALTSGRLADIIGRKMTMRFAAVVGLFGWLTIYLAKDAMGLYVGRVLLGYCTGVLSYVVPVFISEIAPKDVRGGLATSNQLFICSGCSAAYIIGALLSWRSLVAVGLVPCAILLLGLFFIPESPRWLANIGREKEFRASLQKLRGEDSDISEEATEIKVVSSKTASIANIVGHKIIEMNTSCRIILNQFVAYLRPGLKIYFTGNICMQSVGVGLMIFQQLGGINALGFYTGYIFSSAGFPGKLGTILIGIIQIPITFFGAVLMDRSGRRALLLVSSSGTFLGCFLTELSFYFKTIR
ncbi:hypothetical protein ACP70R_048688 [Stipagrostis hirtigluma subsp. patula]